MRRCSRKSALILAVSIVPLLLLVRASQAIEPPRSGECPNIVFIMADDLGYGDLGCYGQRQISTPRIDQLAKEGMRFTDAYAGSTVCAPSRSCLMTGQHTGHTRVRGNARVPLESEDITVAELLRSAGYVNGIVGKWGIGEPDTPGIPTLQGFDSWFGYLNQHHAHNYYPDYLWRNTERVELRGNLNGARGEYTPDLMEREAVAFLRQQQPDRPFFLYLAVTLPHANNELGQSTGNGMEIPDAGMYADRPWPEPQKNHAAMITRLDSMVGRVVDTLDEMGLGQRTLILFTSDNGPHKEGGADPAFFGSSGPLRGYKRDLYEGGIRVPLIARWTGTIAAGATSSQATAFWDFMPTAAELAGVEVPTGIDGLSIVPTLLGEERAKRPQEQHEFLYWEFHERNFKQAVRYGDLKGVRIGDKPLELYDLRADVGETHNIAAEHPGAIARIKAYLRTARTDSEHWPVQPSND